MNYYQEQVYSVSALDSNRFLGIFYTHSKESALARFLRKENQSICVVFFLNSEKKGVDVFNGISDAYNSTVYVNEVNIVSHPEQISTVIGSRFKDTRTFYNSTEGLIELCTYNAVDVRTKAAQCKTEYVFDDHSVLVTVLNDTSFWFKLDRIKLPIIKETLGEKV